MPFTALSIDPYERTATVIELASTPEQGAAQSSVGDHLSSGRLYGIAANGHNVPVAHWPLFAPLVHAKRGDAHDFSASVSLDLGCRVVYKHTAFRGLLYTRDDMPDSDTPERAAIPGFTFRDSVQPGVWWNGCAVLVLYNRNTLRTHECREFLEVTARAAISWTRLPSCVQTSRMRLTFGERLLSADTVPTCALCAQYINERPKRCGGCQRVYYCGPACQREHWASHKDFCRLATTP